jgi:ABC-type antimicrobial peptide transport system permease subunit
MNLLSAFVVGLKEIWANKFRALLTMLGIILGVASLVAMTALIKGMENGMKEALVAIGGLERITLYATPVPTYQRHRAEEATGLTMDDVAALRRSAPLVKEVSPEIRLMSSTLGHGRKHYRPRAWVTGTTPEFLDIYQHEIGHGRAFNEVDAEEARSVCVIGTAVRDELFGSPEATGREIIPVGERITINNQLFTVIGMFKHYESEQDRKTRELAQSLPKPEEKKGVARRPTSRSRGANFVFDMKNSTVLMPVTTAWMRFRMASSNNFVPDPHLNGMSIKVVDPEALDAAVQQVRNVLLVRHAGIEDFNVDTAEQWSSGIESAIRNARLSGGIIAGISLLVGGIGIMNIMLASITERVREIGIRKAVGASFRDIFTQVLVESVVIAIIGGFAGLAASTALVHLLSSMSPTENAPQITVTALLIAFAFSVGVGIAAGIFPAFKAAKLSPMQALRYE